MSTDDTTPTVSDLRSELAGTDDDAQITDVELSNGEVAVETMSLLEKRAQDVREALDEHHRSHGFEVSTGGSSVEVEIDGGGMDRHSRSDHGVWTRPGLHSS
jgi:hypothetical protein